MIRLGLCCIFRDELIKFRTTTAAAVKKLRQHERLASLADICLSNSHALLEARQYCSGHGIRCFRINSQILPIKTHPEVGYDLGEFPGREQMVDQFRRYGEFARANGLRTTFHPDQFVVLNSPKPEVVEHSIAELACPAEVADWVGAGVINVHAGGVYGDKPSEPLFHISSPLEGWKGPKPSCHHDFINVRDCPQCWYNLDVTVEVEAKAKEVAIQRLETALENTAR